MKLLILIVLLFTVAYDIVFGNELEVEILIISLDDPILRDCVNNCSVFRERIKFVSLHPGTKWCDCKDKFHNTLIFAPPDWIPTRSRARSDGQLSMCTEEKLKKLIRCASLP